MHYDFINVITFISIKVEEWSVSISYILTLCILSEILTKSLSYRGKLGWKMGSNPKVIGSSFELVGFYCGGKKLSFSLITPSIKIILKKYLNNS